MSSIQTPPAAAVAEAVLAAYQEQLSPVALCITTPVPARVPLESLSLPTSVLAFVRGYEPEVSSRGLYEHQAAVLRSLGQSKLSNVVMTTATGSGKSLAFWAWTVETLRRDPAATAIATFPTQALLWGQAARLERISEPSSLIRFGEQAYAGLIDIGGVRVPWTVWYGTRNCKCMAAHEASAAFNNARIRITTLDKAHWSLMRRGHEGYLRNLRAFILDEAHVWHGYQGANVRATLNRIRVGMQLLRRPAPAFFLASATLAEPATFASNLTGCPPASFLSVGEANNSTIDRVRASDVPALIRSSAAEGGSPKRYVLLLKPGPAPVSARQLLGDEALIGTGANAICFVQSKFAGHLLRTDLERAAPHRAAIAYDADMTAEDRRRVERDLHAHDKQGVTLVATSALELGVDVPDLDAVVMDDLPPRRADLVQRLGRVGRRADRPGLAVLCLGASAMDMRLLSAPAETLSLADAKLLPMPLHLESIQLRSMRATFEDWRSRLKYRQVSWSDFNAALEAHYGDAPRIETLNARIQDKLGSVVDIDSPSWFYEGFRASVSQGKVPLVLAGTDKWLAQIDHIAVFRDAHPEAVYLGHTGKRYRVVRYRGSFRAWQWSDPRSDLLLGKFLKTIEAVEVVEEPRRVATRGRWRDNLELQELRDDPGEGAALPERGTVEYGVWNFVRQFDGYAEIDLAKRKATRVVSIGEVSERFKQAVESGGEFPFLHRFAYRTLGWRWKLARILPDPDGRKRLGQALESLLHDWFCDAVECAHGDLTVSFDAASAELRVLDTVPGGTGLSVALFSDQRALQALVGAEQFLSAWADRPAKAFRQYLAEQLQVDADLTASEVADAIGTLARAWQG